MIGGIAIVNSKDLFDVDITEKGNFVGGGFLQGLLTAASNLLYIGL